MKNIAIFASGTGSNARKIIEYFALRDDVTVQLVVSNRADAPVLTYAAAAGIDTILLNRQEFYQTENVLSLLDKYAIDLIVLAGFLWLVPAYMVEAYAGRIVNIHPALLPKYGGKGMYGAHVHEAVKQAGDAETGITIHFVNEQYDEGAIIFQAKCPVTPADTVVDIARKVQQLEHQHFAPVIDQLLQKIAITP